MRARYSVQDIDQWQADAQEDLVPGQQRARECRLRNLATDAVIYGLPSVYQYAQMYRQAVDTHDRLYVGFNQFSHQRELAGPDFEAFRTPNVDTLYSNAWLDLTAGPAIIDIPPMGDRYYTLQFCDAHANATNLSSRTVGPDGGRFLVTPPGHDVPVPAGSTRFRVASPYMWILMRIALSGRSGQLEEVHDLQDRTLLTGVTGDTGVEFPPCSAESVESDWETFFTVLDFALRHNGHPVEEVGLVRRYRSLGLGHDRQPLDVKSLAITDRSALSAGFEEATSIIVSCREEFGQNIDGGWMTGTAGDNGFNYLRRAVQNYVGTGGNVSEEKRFFVCWVDEAGNPLDGSQATYTVRFDTPPPVRGHWSLTLYDAQTRLPVHNRLDRYAISPWEPDLRYDPDGSLTIVISHEVQKTPNWLPAPAAPFYVDLRAWEPGGEILDGSWHPQPIRAHPRSDDTPER